MPRLEDEMIMLLRILWDFWDFFYSLKKMRLCSSLEDGITGMIPLEEKKKQCIMDSTDVP
jgi:hypothetical protein